jgi:hypothetical protein
MVLICSIYRNIDLLPHFIKHYRSLGINTFIFGVWEGKSNPLWDDLQKYQENGILFEQTGSGIFSGIKDAKSHNHLRWKYVKKGEWYVIADLDEFHQLEDFRHFQELAKHCEEKGANYVRSQFEDRLTTDGSLPTAIDSQLDIFEQFPVSFPVTLKLVKGETNKIIMARKEVKVGAGHHFVKSFPNFVKKSFPFVKDFHFTEGFPWLVKCVALNRVFKTAHFKWWGQVVKSLQSRRINDPPQKLPWVAQVFQAEAFRTLEHIKQHNGRICIDDL